MGISAGITALLGDIGVTGAAATIGTGLIEGAGIGAAEGLVTGGNIGKDALFGGLTGGIGAGAGGALASLGVNPTLATIGGDVLGGVGASAITGGKIGTGALTGLLAGGLGAATGNVAQPFGGGGASPTPGGGVSSAAGTAAPASIDPNVSAGAGPTNLLTSAGLPDPASGLVDSGATATAGALQTVGTGSGGEAGLPGSVNSGATAGGGSASTGIGTSGDQFASLPAAASATTSNAAASVPTIASTPGATPVTTISSLSGAGPTNLLVDASGNPLPGTDPSAVDPGSYVSGATAYGAGGGATGATGAGGVLGSNPKLAATALAGLTSILRGNQQPAGYANIAALAGQEQAQAAQLQSSLQSGNLPPGLQAGINQALNASVASIKSQYASRGMSGSSAEQQDIQNAHERAAAQAGQVAQQLYQTGIQEMSMSDQMYAQIMAQSNKQNEQTSAAIGNFASALATMA